MRQEGITVNGEVVTVVVATHPIISIDNLTIEGVPVPVDSITWDPVLCETRVTFNSPKARLCQ